MVFVSGYESKLYDSLLTEKKGWHKKSILTTTKDATGQSHERIEILWTNKYFREALETGKLPIIYTEKELRQGKINPKR